MLFFLNSNLHDIDRISLGKGMYNETKSVYHLNEATCLLIALFFACMACAIHVPERDCSPIFWNDET